VQFNCEDDQAKDEAVFEGKNNDILLFDAKKLRFDEAFRLRSVSSLCKEEKNDFERV